MTNNVTDVTRSILHGLVTSQGATVNFETDEAPATDYMVGGYSNELSLPYLYTHAFTQAVASYVIENASLVSSDPALYFGAWITADTAYIDVSRHYADDNTDAYLIDARERGQLAVWNLSTCTEVWIDHHLAVAEQGKGNAESLVFESKEAAVREESASYLAVSPWAKY